MSSEFEVLISTICNASSSLADRSRAEGRLLDILSDIHTWQQYLPLLYTSNDMICFFIGIGFQRLLWRHWHQLTSEQQVLLLNTVKHALCQRKLMQSFTQAKLEQVFTSICVNMVTIEPVLAMLSDQSSVNSSVSLSLARTCIDFICSDDPKLDPKTKSTLLQQIQSNHILLPMTNLAANTCANALQSYNEETLNMMIIALELLKIIIGKMAIGPHITVDVLNLLFTIAELGADPKSAFHRCALSSIEILTEVMSKKYIPASASGDRGVGMIMHLVNKNVALLKSYREHGNIDDSDIVLQLLEFTSMFAESHLERCIEHSNGSMGTNSQLQQSIAAFFHELVSITTVSTDPKVLTKVVTLWNHVLFVDSVKEYLLSNTQQVILPIMSHLLQSVLTSSNSNLSEDYEDLIADLKYDLLVDPHIKEVLNSVVSTLSSSSSSTNNSTSNKGSGHASGDVHSAEEFDQIGSTLIAEVKELFVELTMTNEIKEWLHHAIQPLTTRTIQMLLQSIGNSRSEENMQKAVLDLLVLLRILPMTSSDVLLTSTTTSTTTTTSSNNSLPSSIGMTNSSLLMFLLQFLTQLPLTSLNPTANPSQQSLVILVLQVCQIMQHLLPTSALATYSTQHVQHWLETATMCIQVLFRQVVACIMNFQQQPSNTLVLQSLTIFLTQVITAFQDLGIQPIFLNANPNPTLGTNSLLEELRYLTGSRQSMPVEVYALLLCCQDMILASKAPQSPTTSNPSEVGVALVNQYGELFQSLVQGIQSPAQFPSVSASLESMLVIMSSLDVLTRHHSLAKAHRRQAFIAALTPLQDGLPRASQFFYQLLIEVFKFHLQRRSSGVSSSPQIGENISLELGHRILRCHLSLNCAVLQCLGKKTFGATIGMVFELSVNFLASVLSDLGIAQLCLDSAGLKWVTCVLELSRIVAESTHSTSSNTSNYVGLTYQLVNTITPFLSDERICGELLQPTLKAGIVAIRSYWQKASTSSLSKSLTFPVSNPNPSTMIATNGTSNSSNGENVSHLVQALVTLCIGSLGSGIPPQDTLLALEGILSLKEQHNLFSQPWFQTPIATSSSAMFNSLFLPTLRAIVLRMHMIHYYVLESMFLSLCDAKLAYIKNQHKEANEASLSEKVKEFWYFVAEEIVKIAAEYKCAERSHAILTTTFQQLTTATSRSSPLLDSQVMLKELISPVIAEISRQN